METNNYKVITAWDDKEDVKAVVKVEGEKKILTLTNYEWFFCLSLSDFELVSSILLKYKAHGIVKRTEKQGEYMKIYAWRNKTVWENNEPITIRSLHKAITTQKAKPLEIDLPIYKRWLHDNTVEIETDIRVLFFDIETDDTIGNIEIGRDRILSISFCDTEGNNTFISNPDEKILLTEAIALINTYDAICGWNSAKFDLPYIQERMKRHGIEYEWKKIVHVDMMLRLIKLFASISGLLGLNGFSLNEVSRVFLKDSKVKFEGKIIELYRNDFEKFKEYNIKDTALLYQLNEKINCMHLMIKECEWTGTFLNNFYIGEILDNYILREAKKKNKYLYSRPLYSESDKNKKLVVRGGFVMTPTPGYYENVRVFDFKSMYPSIIITWNIGEDSLNKEISAVGNKSFYKFLRGRKVEEVDILEIADFLTKQKKLLDPEDKHFQTANNAFFSKEHESLIPKLVKELLDQRKVYKKKLDSLIIDTDEYRTARATQEVVKEMANSIFGITADRTSRYFNMFVCEGITLTGQFLNRMSMELAKKRNISSIYGDTDSFFLLIPDDKEALTFAKDLNDDLSNFLHEFFSINKSIVYVEYEKKFSKLILISKKKYSGRLTWMDDKETDIIFSRGVELVKKDTIGYTKKHILRLIEMITKEDATLETCKTWIEERKKEIETIELTAKDLSITVRVARSPSSYKTPLLHVRIAAKLIKDGLLQDINEGKTNAARISYIVTGTENGMQGVELRDFTGEWDRHYYWDVKIYAPFKRILEVVFPEEDWDSYIYKELEKRSRKNKNQLSLF